MSRGVHPNSCRGPGDCWRCDYRLDAVHDTPDVPVGYDPATQRFRTVDLDEYPPHLPNDADYVPGPDGRRIFASPCGCTWAVTHRVLTRCPQHPKPNRTLEVLA